MPVIVDAMGGDHAPHEIVKGALSAAQEFGIDVVLVGKEPELAKFGINNPHIQLHHAESAVLMHENPARAVRSKPDSSIAVATRLLKAGRGAALVSAGNTGAVMASAFLELGAVKGIDRPAIATTIPTLDGSLIAIDCGANVDCKPSQLLEFAHMGSLYARHVLGVAIPRIGLLNIGTETGKGNALAKETQKLLRASGLEFVGNVEGTQIFKGVVDVLVTDGFVGNIFLKTSEGLSEMFFHALDEALKASGADGAVAETVAKRLERYSCSNPANSGAPLLGVDGCVIIAHGASRADTIKNAIALGHRYSESGALQFIREACPDWSARA
ncbi:MAG: phosphate acyltransferase PlsX [Candidatus Wallbacteria bacterium]|nr:phosphate acyltransferase PlsX [Candidatus Wallbacteria bacterium]